MNGDDVDRQDDSVLTTAFTDAGEPAPPRRRRSTLVKVFVGMAIAVVVIVAGTAGAAVYLANKLDNVQRIDDVFTALPESERPGKAPAGADAMNILLVGSDVRAEGQTTGSAGTPTGTAERSDAIMLVHLPAERKDAYVVSLPRDLWVAIPGHADAKINAAYAYGGPTLLVRTIEKLTDVQIDHYAQVDFAGFESMTDAVGGVDVRGAGHLDGKAALKYVRERKALAGGDFDRIKRQHAFLRALMAKSTGKSTGPGAFTDLLDAATRSVSVDDGMSPGDLRSLALSLRGLRGGDVHFRTAPHRGTGMVGDQSVVVLDPVADRKLWTALRNDAMGTWRR
jgi:anionic cell wall polymer biosynthesis LytR-Cps2A-Psr (LCP) family protein